MVSDYTFTTTQTGACYLPHLQLALHPKLQVQGQKSGFEEKGLPMSPDIPLVRLGDHLKATLDYETNLN